MDLDFDGRVALVTGAGRGLGRAYAKLLAARGASVIVADLPGENGAISPATPVVAEIEEAGGVALAAGASVAKPEGGEALVRRALNEFGRLDIVINNAGIVRDSSIGKLSDEDLRQVIDVHLIGAFNVIRPAWAQMREQGYGRILNTTSNSGILGNFGQSNYAAAKMGLVGLTRVLAIEGHRYGILANALAPMGRTPMTADVQWDVFDSFTVEQVAPVAAWLVHEQCQVSGEVYSAAGGHVARFFTGLTPGFQSAALDVEEVRDNFEEIRATEGFAELGSATEEIERLATLLEA
jgi:NAD(P)-dependent dehydrogenase (short-subunit alcohol dehydrogenase family)